MALNEKKQMKRVAHGNALAFKKIFDAHSGKIFGHLKHSRGDLSAENLSEQLWTKVATRAQEYLKTENFKTTLPPNETFLTWALSLLEQTSAQPGVRQDSEEFVPPEHRDRVLARAERFLSERRAHRRRFVLGLAGAGLLATVAAMVKIKIIDGPPTLEPAALQTPLLKDFEIVKDLEFFEDLRHSILWRAT